MVMNDQLTLLSFHANQPFHSSNKAISNFDLETTRSKSLVWSKHKTIQSAQCLNWFALFLFHINQITIPEIKLFWNLTLKNRRSRSWVRSKVEITKFTQYQTNAHPFCFTSIGPTIPEICSIVFDLEKTHTKFSRQIWQKKVSNRILPKSYDLISMSRGM